MNNADPRPFTRTPGGAPLPRDLDAERPLVKAPEFIGAGANTRFNLDKDRLLDQAKKGAVDLVVDAKASVRQWTFDEMIREVEAMKRHLPKVEDGMSAASVIVLIEAALPFMLNNWAREEVNILAAQEEPPSAPAGTIPAPAPQEDSRATHDF